MMGALLRLESAQVVKANRRQGGDLAKRRALVNREGRLRRCNCWQPVANDERNMFVISNEGD